MPGLQSQPISSGGGNLPTNSLVRRSNAENVKAGELKPDELDDGADLASLVKTILLVPQQGRGC